MEGMLVPAHSAHSFSSSDRTSRRSVYLVAQNRQDSAFVVHGSLAGRVRPMIIEFSRGKGN